MYQTDCVAQLGAARLHSLTAVNVRRSRLLNKVAVSLYSLYFYQKFLLERESFISEGQAVERTEPQPTERPGRYPMEGVGGAIFGDRTSLLLRTP